MRARQSAFRRGIALGTVTLAISAGLTTGASAATPPAGPDSDRAATPVLDWAPCPGETGPPGSECATARVPLSYRDPAGPQISLALTKRPAKDPQHKIGTVFTNPGGPGSSGRIPPRLSPVMAARFDIVGFDPRGIRNSTPVTCSDDPADDAKLSPVFPVTEAEEAAAIRQVGEVTARCAQHAGPLLGHMSTANVARDLDLLRRAVGDQQLSYLGTSYGTHLGEVYANLFPQRVRAMVLDGVLQPQEWTTGTLPGQSGEPYIYRIGSYLGAQTALNTVMRECAAHAQCEFGEPGATEQSLHRKYDDLLATLRRGPVTLTDSHGETQQITYQDLVMRMLSGLYNPDAAADLTPFLQTLYLAAQHPAATAPAPGHVPVPAPPRFSRAAEPDEPQIAYNTWHNAVACTDTDNPRDPRAVGRYARLAEAAAPGFASVWIYAGLPCASWLVTDPDRYTGPWNRPTANPVLLIGNRLGDPATPYEDAVSTSHLLGRARLLTADIAGHGVAYDGRNQCVDQWLDGYLTDLTLPPAGTVCAAERGPFDPPSGSR
ncbi:alpha/beta hydrolase [Amycolatopsis balhimycina DSM 5908]|uniref:Alpha/beta hydrolase n=1 Tax=Amycolatopsis balhimycina DSM 5908 TaxID=1081091 RepID=A0A428VV01_AMYBA|nr:alpha/beta hydrolase [Amycolatopsis balhimycina]RSM34647.1 alpha/beta hydrolase [Amycolatopsis balhimycina DSM 5908]